MKHTKEPWRYTGIVDHQHVQNSQLVLQSKGMYQEEANIAKVIPCVGMTAEEVEANAARIVACVNACAGMSNEAVNNIRKTRAALMDTITLLLPFIAKAIEENAFKHTANPKAAQRAIDLAEETLKKYAV